MAARSNTTYADGWLTIPDELLDDPQVSGDGLRAWLVLDRAIRKRGETPSGTELCQMLGVSRATLTRLLDELEHAGWLSRKRAHHAVLLQIEVKNAQLRLVKRTNETTYARKNTGLSAQKRASTTQENGTQCSILSTESVTRQSMLKIEHRHSVEASSSDTSQRAYKGRKSPVERGSGRRLKATSAPDATPGAQTGSSLAPGGRPPNRSQQVIDALSALGLSVKVDYDLSSRDHGAIKHSTAAPELLAEAFQAAHAGTWVSDGYLRQALSMHLVVDRINAYRVWRGSDAGSGRLEDPRRGSGAAPRDRAERPATSPARAGQIGGSPFNDRVSYIEG